MLVLFQVSSNCSTIIAYINKIISADIFHKKSICLTADTMSWKLSVDLEKMLYYKTLVASRIYRKTKTTISEIRYRIPAQKSIFLLLNGWNGLIYTLSRWIWLNIRKIIKISSLICLESEHSAIWKLIRIFSAKLSSMNIIRFYALKCLSCSYQEC